MEFVSNVYLVNDKKVIQCNIRDITQRKWPEEDRQKLMTTLQSAFARIKELKELLPICSYCKKIRNDKGYWQISKGILLNIPMRRLHTVYVKIAQKYIFPR